MTDTNTFVAFSNLLWFIQVPKSFQLARGYLVFNALVLGLTCACTHEFGSTLNCFSYYSFFLPIFYLLHLIIPLF